ncbi:MAG: hypothetical protein JJ953_08465 [Gracilimonas sp.]|uniref:hypothetical protein n=1 Tax=Gracilimonas sp. TaxID=1974203 RepID=UPI001B24DE43|nr:hypothetical protein [Gracilimonas sp.]MBO6586120.1 hypothetical protein [Gracilimonas sp.]MBO6614777.1 hypothetical protein [Gracilimonas sp.]
MHTDENKAIRYLMKEMDPSEEMEFEKLMREDEDLLIEVESLRATKRRLSGLPLKTPPQKLTQKITDDAKQLQSDSLKKSKNITFFLKRGIAAAILLAAFTGGGYYFYTGEAVTFPATASDSQTIEPWVDRNEILRFSGDQPVSQSASLKSDMDKSYDKLELVNDLNGSSNAGSGILLTGSSN